MTYVVFGASGLIGRFLVPRLRARGADVIGVSRHARPPAPGVDWRKGQLPDTVPALPVGVDAIVCLGPLDHFSHWLQGAAIVGSPTVVAMSSMSAESKRHSPVAAERELAARLSESEQRLLARCAALGCACTILRATLIYGGAGGSLEKLAAQARRRHVFASPRGRGLRQPVHADDLAQAVVAALDGGQSLGIVCAGGGERLSASRMFARARQRLAPGAVGVPVPGRLIGIRENQRGMAARLRQDLVADNTCLRDVLGVEPRGFLEDPEQDGH